MQLELGKLPKRALIKNILSRIKVSDDVLLPPAFGEDGAVITTKGNIIVVVADPITGATSEAGWLAVHVNANDVAVHAAYPKWFISTLLFPIGTKETDIEQVMDGVIEALSEVRATLIGGHTEITDRVKEIIISGAMIGEPMVDNKYITSGGAKDGDAIVITKGVGIEGTFILARDFKASLLKKLDEKVLNEAMKLRRMISILPDVEYSIKAIGIENIHAMHDVTEGGLLGGLYEMAFASGIGFKIYEDKIPVLKPTKEICSVLRLDPLKLIGSGSLILAVDPEFADDLVSYLMKNKINSAIIGNFTKKYQKEGIIIKRNGKIIRVKDAPMDELWHFFARSEY